MTTSKSLKALAIIFFISGIWDTIGGITFLFGSAKSDPPIHSFYSIFIASFFFCFAYLQILSSFNMKRYLFIIGAVMIGRIFYVVLLYSYIWGVDGFHTNLWWTGIVQVMTSVSEIYSSQSGGKYNLVASLDRTRTALTKERYYIFRISEEITLKIM
jgi:hypothetical protein